MRALFDISGWFVPMAQRLLYAWCARRYSPRRLRTSIRRDLSAYGPAGPPPVEPAGPFRGVPARRPAAGRGAVRAGSVRAKRSLFFLNRRNDGLRAGSVPPAGRSTAGGGGGADPRCATGAGGGALGPQPDKQESILKALLAETWRSPGRLRQFLAVLLHGRQTLVRFNRPLSLRELVHGGATPPRRRGGAAQQVSQVLRVHFRRQREMAIGPDLSHRNTQIETLLASDPVRLAIGERRPGWDSRLTRRRPRRTSSRWRSSPTTPTASRARRNSCSPGCWNIFTTASRRTTSKR